MNRTRQPFLVLISVASVFSVPLAADEADDREQIDALMWHYARALDTLNADAYVALYTEEGEFIAGPTPVKGRDALHTMIENLRADREQRVADGEPPAPAMFHMTTDSWTEFVDATHARHHTYWLTVFGSAEAGGAPNVAAAGRGVDELVKVDGRWLISRRNVSPSD